MIRTSVKLTALVGLGILAGMVERVTAADWAWDNERTVLSFSRSVQLPGQVLAAGTYVFKLADSPSDRNIVQVFSADEKHLIGTFRALPDERLGPMGKTIIAFEEREGGLPPAVKEWFYPGDAYLIGHQFVYPKGSASASIHSAD